jgi:hypothetical protein
VESVYFARAVSIPVDFSCLLPNCVKMKVVNNQSIDVF